MKFEVAGNGQEYALAEHTHAYAPTSHAHPYAPVAHSHDAVYAPIVHTHASGMKKGADQNFTAITYSDVTNLSFPVLANTDYVFEFMVIWSSAATTTGVAFAINGPSSPVYFFALIETATSATTLAIRQDTSFDSGTASASIDLANTNRVCRIAGVIRNGVNAGTLSVRCKSEVSGSAITVKRGSWGTYQ